MDGDDDVVVVWMTTKSGDDVSPSIGDVWIKLAVVPAPVDESGVCAITLEVSTLASCSKFMESKTLEGSRMTVSEFANKVSVDTGAI